MSAQAMTSTYQGLVGVLGETDRSVETAGNMFALCGDNQASLQQMTTALTGAYSQFGDGLLIESLAEAANETAKCGLVTGGFADALNWVNASSEQWSAALGGNKAASDAFSAAVSQGATKEDAFNAALAACSDEGERQQLVISAMNALYGEAGQKYQEANKDLIAYNQSQDALGQAVAGLGEKFMPAATLLQTMAAQVLTALSNMIPPIDTAQMTAALQSVADFAAGTLAPAFQPVSDALGNFAGVVGPLLVPLIQQIGALLAGVAPVIATIMTAVIDVVAQISAFVMPIITQIAAWVAANMPMIQGVVTSVMAAVQAVVTAALAVVQAVWNAVFPAIKGVIDAVFPAIQQVVSGVMGAIQGVVNVVLGIINGDWSQVWAGIQGVAQGVWDAISGIVSGAIEGVRAAIDGALSIIKGIWDSAWGGISSFLSDTWENVSSAVSDGVDNMMSFIEGIPESIKGFFSDAGEWLLDAGKSIIDGLAEGIKGAVDGVVNAVTGVVDTIRGFFPFSPAKEGPFSGHGYTTFSGKALMGGFAEGIEGQAGRVAAATRAVLGAARDGLSARVAAAVDVRVPDFAPAPAGRPGAPFALTVNTLNINARDLSEVRTAEEFTARVFGLELGML